MQKLPMQISQSLLLSAILSISVSAYAGPNATHEHMALLKGALNNAPVSKLIEQTKQLASHGYRIVDQPARNRIMAKVKRGTPSVFSFSYDGRDRIQKINSTLIHGEKIRDCLSYNRPIVEKMIQELGLTNVKRQNGGGHIEFTYGKRKGWINTGNWQAGYCQIAFVAFPPK